MKDRMWFERVAVLPMVEATTSEGRRIRGRVELDVVFGRIAARLYVLETEPSPPLEVVHATILVGTGEGALRVPVRWELDFSGADRASDFVITQVVAPPLDATGSLEANAAFPRRGRTRADRRRRPAG